MKQFRLCLRIAVAAIVSTQACLAQGAAVKIGLIGDSTVAEQSGWGPAFAGRFNEQVKVFNHAVNGATLQSLSKRLDELAALKPDYVLIQFGHNDQKRYDTEVYSGHLRSYVERIRKAGCKPIIVTSVTRRSFDANGKITANLVKSEKVTYHGTLTEYARAAQSVAGKMQVPFIDLHTLSIAFHNRIGPAASMAYNFKDDDKTHFNRSGGEAITDLIIPELTKIVPELGAYLKDNKPESATAGMRTTSMMTVAVGATVTQGAGTGKGLSPEEVLAGVKKRADAIIRAEAGKPLVRAKKNPPLGPERGPYVRGYSYSILAFAARCLCLGEKLDEANAALVENAQYYLDNPMAICDRDSFHWHAEIVLRLLEMYGPKGSVRAGLITKNTEAKALEYMWIYTKKCSWLGKAEYRKTRTWNVYSSENHHAMDFTCHWHFSKYAKDRPEYKDLKCDDGATLSEHFKAWNDYIVEYCRERARRGLCVEMRSDGYNSTLIKGFYNFYDFGDKELKKVAGMFLDMYFAYWAEEQIMGHMGGGASRIKGNNAYIQSRKHGNAVLAWLYFAIGEQPELNGHDVSALLSGYRPPAVVADIARDTEGRGKYEIRQRVQGLGYQGHTFPHMDRPDQKPNQFQTDGGGILRYSYCDPAFILGTPMCEARPMSDWVMISSQSRWQGAIFAGEGDPRIVPVPRAANNKESFNQFWSVQSKGSLITQKLKTSKGAAEMMVWMSKKGLGEPVKDDDIVFIEAPGAYAAVRVGRGGFKLTDEVFKGTKEEGTSFATPPCHILVPDDEYAPVILEVMAKGDVKNFDEFKSKVKSSKPKMNGADLKYKTIYGDELTFDTSCKKKPAINGKSVDYAPKKVFDSPFFNADYDSGIVTISKGDRKKILDFN